MYFKFIGGYNSLLLTGTCIVDAEVARVQNILNILTGLTVPGLAPQSI
jgi:hypothetical protein